MTLFSADIDQRLTIEVPITTTKRLLNSHMKATSPILISITAVPSISAILVSIIYAIKYNY